jgi:hypothetical protein
MSIRIVIDIDIPKGPQIDAGGYTLAGVNVVTEPFTAADQPASIGATWAGLCVAINDFMRSRGATNFNCLRQLNQDRAGRHS